MSVLKLTKEYPFAYETHLHTSEGSACGRSTGAEMARACKPDRAIFEKAFDIAGVKPEEVLFIGDSVTSDVKPALELGITPVLIVRSGGADRSSVPGNVRVIKSLVELNDLNSDLY